MESSSRPPDDNGDGLDHLEAQLARLDEQLAVVCDIGFALDPELLSDAVDLGTQGIQAAIESVLSEVECRGMSTDELVDHASHELLKAATFPFIIQITRTSLVPELKHSGQALLAALMRTMQVVADFAGPHSLIQVTTGAEGADATIAVQAEAPTNPNEVPIELRTCTLDELVRDLEGRITLQRDEHSVGIHLSLPGARARV